MARLLLAAWLAAASGACSAEDWWIGPAFSYHTRREGQREWHPGIGFERRWSELWRGLLDVRQNSSNDLSIYAVGCYTPWQALGWRLGGCAGVATGYSTRDKAEAEHRERSTWEALKPAPFGALAASRDWRHHGLNVGVIPLSEPVFFLQIKFPLR